MSRILVISPNPPQLMGERKIEAAHFRAWQFLQPLINDGHDICLCTDPDGDPGEMPDSWRERISYRQIPFGEGKWRSILQATHDAFRPEGIIAVNYSHGLYATALRTQTPLWIDIYGDILTIIQAYSFRRQSNRGLATTIGFMRQILRSGDVFSVCGTPQKHMLIGEMAMVGRLEQRTFGYEFGEVILPAAPDPIPPDRRQFRKRRFLQEFGIDEEAFIVLWAGGYNTWTDIETLFRGLVYAMEKNRSIHYVSVGANTYIAPDNVYDQLQKLIADSPFADRFHLLGWRPWTEIHDFYLESDVGINIDALHYETLYGTRTRLVEMIGAGLPIVTTLGSELSYLLEERGAAATFHVGEYEKFGQCLLDLAASSPMRQTIAACAYEYARSDLSLAETTQAVRKWARAPIAAPDKQKPGLAERIQNYSHRVRANLRLAIWVLLGSDK